MKLSKFKFLALSAIGLSLIACSTPGNSSISSTSENTSSSNSETSADTLSSSSISSDTSVNPLDYYNTVEERARFDKNNKLNFDEDFSGGMSDDHFLALEGAWHTDVVGAEHNGMKIRNLFYTNDGTNDYLAIKARGMYNTEDPTSLGKPEGGAIITKEHLRPGRYEIKMAAMPREAGVSAMWTYCTTTGNELTSQNEIDIEIGGTTNGTQFKNIWFTSWTKKETKETNPIDVTDALYLNDGKIHTYTFDWYTNYNNQDIRRVDWFIDGVYYNSLTGNVVPEHEMPLWIGIWFPPLWAGTAAFDTDYLLIDNIAYTAFDHTQYYESCRAEPGYTKKQPSVSGIQTIDFRTITDINKLSNSSFESLDKSPRDGSYYGWKEDGASKGTVTLDTGKTNKGYKLTASTTSTAKYHGEYLKQEITNTFPGYEFSFKIDAKKVTEESVGNIEIYYRDETNATIKTDIIPVDSLDLKTYTKEIVVPVGVAKLEFDITAEDGSIIYDNASLIFHR